MRRAYIPVLVVAMIALTLPVASPMAHLMDSPTPPTGAQLWKNVFLCGTELEQLDQVYRVQWDFEHLDQALMAGDLSLERASSPDEKVRLL